MIVVDIETSGLYPEKNGIWQIGAIDLSNPENKFIEECRIDDSDRVDSGALEITGKTETYLRNTEKQSQKELIENFFLWASKSKIKNFVCQNPQFDLGFLTYKSRKYSIKFPFKYRAFDLHSIASYKYHTINKNFLIENGGSDMNLKNVLKLCGLKDLRGAHNSLEDARLIAECFSRIIHGRSIIEEFFKIPVPDYLINK